MGYGGSPTGPDSWTSDRLSSSASVFRSVVFTSPDDNGTIMCDPRDDRRMHRTRMQKNCQVVPQIAHRERYVTAYRYRPHPSTCNAPAPPPLRACGVGAVAARTRRLYSTYLPVNVTLSSSASAHPATQHAPGARYRGTAAALQLPYPCPNGPHGHAQHKGRTEAT